MFDGWQADLYYQYGENTRKGYQHGLRVDRVFAALDAVDQGLETTGVANGNIVCRVTLFSNAFPGCEPLNLFGRGNASAEALDDVTGYKAGTEITTPIYYADTGYARGDSFSFTTGTEKLNRTKIKQHVAEIDFNGDVVEGWAGPISLAFGGSFRREEILQLVEDETNPPALGDIGVNDVDDAFYLDLRLTYGFEIASGAEIEAFAAVTNLTDQDPPKRPITARSARIRSRRTAFCSICSGAALPLA